MSIQEDLQRLPKDWRKRLCVVKDALKAALGQLDPAIAAQGQSSSASGDGKEPLNYFLAVAVFDQLKPGAQKSVLGWFQGEAGTWEKIVAAYRKQGESFDSECLQQLPICRYCKQRAIASHTLRK